MTRILTIIILATIVIVGLYALGSQYKECKEKRGVLVKGLFGYACIQEAGR